MVAPFEFSTAQRVIFGRGKLDQIGTITASFGRHAFIVRGGSYLHAAGAIAKLESSLVQSGVAVSSIQASGEPTTSTIDDALLLARANKCDVVIGIGGGSALDTAKAVSGLLANEGRVLDYLEVVGLGKTISTAIPMIAIPTTAGTGSEVTRNAVIAVKEKSFKASMRSLALLPRVALVDPCLTDGIPSSITASTGLDALTQLIEPYVSSRAQPLTDGIALQGIRLAARALPQAFEDGSNKEARDKMALAALMGGMCLANAGLGAVHGFAAPLGAAFPVPHGIACAALLPHVVMANIHALRNREPSNPALLRYIDVARALVPGTWVQSEQDALDAMVQFVGDLVQKLKIPSLAAFGLLEKHVPGLVDQAKLASSMRANPISLTDEELASCLLRAVEAI